MSHTIPCSIEILHSHGETAWIVTLPMEKIPDAIILLTALQYGKLAQIKFTGQHTAVLSPRTLTLDDAAVAVTDVWLEAVMGMFLDCLLNGWSPAAHLDQDFEDTAVCISIAPPAP